jgi:hypothetical protein
MSILLWMALGALVSDLLVLAVLAASPRVRREVAIRLLSTLANEDQEDFLDMLL